MGKSFESFKTLSIDLSEKELLFIVGLIKEDAGTDISGYEGDFAYILNVYSRLNSLLERFTEQRDALRKKNQCEVCHGTGQK